ncbi:GCN5-related N-acetyltransferase [Richelia sinica FACHB-800]|uniref:GCN5-related N-acetyltransferase n=1 Tax=Richelia sinica FACHB-800 TaxID=1357546 RepID=A0A975Y4S3_9NOST|nr:GNAT family N-acetyltransferase [Richelia sinica]MBD2667450.1 GNAT family N-acetyltransferase [Richelia sinica FACHB-800]QXE23472.1 GCN5-related N-acetyltransferase [Richelia sinica FACHB-800]
MNLSIRLLQSQEIETADRLFRLAFGTFVGLADPFQFAGDAAYIRHRYWTEPTGAFAAELDGQLMGSNLATNWGSFGFFGPLSVHPQLWNQGVAKQLIAAVCDRLEAWGIKQAGLFTFPNSAKHHALYQKFGFWPQYLTAVMAKSASPCEVNCDFLRYSLLRQSEQEQVLMASLELTHRIYPGLDLRKEIQAVSNLELGDTIFLLDDSKVVGLAVCHYGAGTEAGSNNCYVKFAAVLPEIHAVDRFAQLLNLCENMALTVGMSNLLAGVNTSRHEAYRYLIAIGFRTQITGVTMQKPNTPGYNRSDIFALDDWR